MEQHQPLSNPPIIELRPASTSQPTPYHSTQVPLSPNRRISQIDQPESNIQPSLIWGFTSTELAHVTIQVTGIIIAAVFGAWAIKSYESANFANRLSQDSLSESDTANRLAQAALQQSLYANILAIINLCLSEQFSNSTYCPALLQAAPLASIIQGVIPTLSSRTQSRSSTPPPPPTSAPATRTPSPTPSPAPTQTSPITTTSPSPTSLTLTTTISVGDSTAAPTQAISNSGGARHIGFGVIVGIIIAAVITVAFFVLLLVRYRRAKRTRF